MRIHYIAAMIVAGMASATFGSLASASSAPAQVRYFEDGKRIAVPDRVPPLYPAQERKRRIGGTAVVAFSYSADGKVTAASIKASTGNRNLDDAAVASVLKWTIEPELRDGARVGGSSEAAVTFNP